MFYGTVLNSHNFPKVQQSWVCCSGSPLCCTKVYLPLELTRAPLDRNVAPRPHALVVSTSRSAVLPPLSTAELDIARETFRVPLPVLVSSSSPPTDSSSGRGAAGGRWRSYRTNNPFHSSTRREWRGRPRISCHRTRDLHAECAKAGLKRAR